MTLLSDSFTTSLLGHRQLSFTRSRPGVSTRDPDTGLSIPGTPTTSSIVGWFSWVPEREVRDFKVDAAAYVLTNPGQVKPGDTITGSPGAFLVMEGGVRPQGEFDRANLRRA